MTVRGRLIAIAMVAVSACQTPAPTPSAEVLRISISRDVVSLDPVQLHQPSVELGLIRNLFNGLYGFDNNLNELPDLATRMPEVSGDGKTWTFHLKPEAKFGNGDAVTAEDVIYSWSRAAQTQSADALVFDPVMGYDAVHSGKETRLAGLSAPNQATVVAQLSRPAGFWLVELGLWPAYVLNEQVLLDHGEKDWWKDPANLNASATGPFQLSKWQHGSSLDFMPTPSWWGGPTGTLTAVRAEIVSDPSDALRRYERGDLDIVGYSPDIRGLEIPIDALQKYSADRSLASQVNRRPLLRTLWIRFNTLIGPLAGSAGEPARKALSEAIDRKAFAAAACDGAITCLPATGGMFLPGLQGYLGAGKDRNAIFDVTAASTALKSWDPSGTKLRNLRLTTYRDFASFANELHRQWQVNLGLDIPVDVVASLPIPRPPIVAGVFVVDYDSPHNWYDDSFRDTPIYSNARFNALVASADAKLPLLALPEYMQAEQILVDDVAAAPLGYLAGVFLVKPSVVGAGGNALYENYWKGISIKTD